MRRFFCAQPQAPTSKPRMCMYLPMDCPPRLLPRGSALSVIITAWCTIIDIDYSTKPRYILHGHGHGHGQENLLYSRACCVSDSVRCAPNLHPTRTRTHRTRTLTHATKNDRNQKPETHSLTPRPAREADIPQCVAPCHLSTKLKRTPKCTSPGDVRAQKHTHRHGSCPLPPYSQ